MKDDPIGTEVTAVAVPHTDPQMEANLRKKIDELQEIYGRNLVSTYYRVGQALTEVLEDEHAGGQKFGQQAMEKIADELNMSKTNLYRCQEVAVNVGWEEISGLIDNPNVKWSHVRELARVKDQQERAKLLTNLVTTPMTVIDFKAQVDAVRTDQEQMGGAPTKDPTERQPNRGGGSRTGQGRGASPLTPIKKSQRLADQLSEQMKDMLEALTDFDPQSETAADRLTDALNETLGSICDVVVTAAGFVQRAEEHMACYPNKLRETAQVARSAAYAQAVTALSKVSCGIDSGTLSPEADPNKEAPPPEPRPEKPAKAGRPPKAAKPESDDPPEPKMPKPRKASSVAQAARVAPFDPELVKPPASATKLSDSDRERLAAEMREKARAARERAQKARAGGAE